MRSAPRTPSKTSAAKTRNAVKSRFTVKKGTGRGTASGKARAHARKKVAKRVYGH